MRVAHRLASLAVLALLAARPAAADHEHVFIGVHADRDHAAVMQEWSPLADALNRAVPGHHFELVPLNRQGMERAIVRGDIAFIVSDPGLYVTLATRHGASRIATRERRVAGRALKRLGTLLFARAERGDLNGLDRLAGQRLVATDPESFAGWQVAVHAIQRLGGDSGTLAERALFTGHDAAAVVRLVRDGEADVGVLPGGRIEGLLGGNPTEHGFKVLDARDTTVYPFAHSTALYPEWAFSRLRFTDDALAAGVVVALLGGDIAGWVAPDDYTPVTEVLRDIGAGPYAGIGSLTVDKLIGRHQQSVTVALVLAVLMVAGTLYTFRLNRRLQQSQARLQRENHERRQAEENLAHYGDELEERIRKRTNELEYQAHYDDLTGLPNRNLLFEKLDQVILAAQQDDSTFALVMIGLDRIREINNTLGHYFGDMLLQQAGDLLVKSLVSSEIIARTSDDAFVMLLVPCERERAEEVASRLHDVLDRTFYLDGHPMHMKAQMGIAMFPEHGIDGDTLMRHADVALHSVRRTRMEYSLYDPSLNRHGLRDLKLLGDLRGALSSEDQLMLYYQPKVDLASRCLKGVETLIRWNHPKLGMVSPELFIPLAEKTGLIRPLTLWVLNAAFDQCRRWEAMGLKIITAINLSAWNLQDVHLISQVRELLDAWGVDPAMLEMEITESAMMTDPERVMTLLQQLSDLGIRLSIDDFGTGFSSLQYLKRLPVDEVKIDKSFVLDMVSNAEDRAIVKATVDLAHSLGLSVIAEGVDDPEGLQMLIEMGCDQAQGYLIAHPLSATDLLKWHVESPWGQALYRKPPEAVELA